MSSHDVRIAQEITVSAVITRCGCAAAGHDWQGCHVWLGPGNPAPCPHPLAIEDKGVVSYWHRRWWRRALARLRGQGRVRFVQPTASEDV